MAGYIFAISQSAWQGFCSQSLRYGFFTPLAIPITKDDMTPRKRKARTKILAATFADLVTMEPGDNIYFLSNRKIYGIGTAVKVGPSCKYDNYSDASALIPDCQLGPTDYLTTPNTQARWVCLFEPAPYFFRKAADMDDILRFRPQAFKMLRAFEGLSFVKVDDEENRALKEYISLINEAAYDDIAAQVFSFDDKMHKRLESLPLSNYVMDISKSLHSPENREYALSEMLIEALLLQELRTGSSVLGKWDYLTHQVIASPFKPLKYIDKIDVFGYRFSVRYCGSPKLITKFLLIELKKGLINRTALEQTMQYVDWICSEYASGDYSRIEAYVVGERSVSNIDSIMQEACVRSFICETHPAVPAQWSNLKLVHYSLEDISPFTVIDGEEA